MASTTWSTGRLDTVEAGLRGGAAGAGVLKMAEDRADEEKACLVAERADLVQQLKKSIANHNAACRRRPPSTVTSMSDERPTRGLFTRASVLFTIAGVWMLFGVVELVLDGPTRWLQPACTLVLAAMYVVYGITVVRKARRRRSEL